MRKTTSCCLHSAAQDGVHPGIAPAEAVEKLKELKQAVDEARANYEEAQRGVEDAKPEGVKQREAMAARGRQAAGAVLDAIKDLEV